MMDRVSGVAAMPRLSTPYVPRETTIAPAAADDAAAAPAKVARNLAPAPVEGEPTDPSKTHAIDGEPTDPDVVGGAHGRFNAVA